MNAKFMIRYERNFMLQSLRKKKMTTVSTTSANDYDYTYENKDAEEEVTDEDDAASN